MELHTCNRSEWAGPIDLEAGWRRDRVAPRALKPKGIILHHTEPTTAFNNNNYQQLDHTWCVARLRHWFIVHVHERKWSDIGYHALICPHGIIFEGRKGGVQTPIQGAHATANNELALGIALMGNFQEELPSASALKSLQQLINWCTKSFSLDLRQPLWWHRFSTPKEISDVKHGCLIGHRDVRNTICPGDRLYQWLGDFTATL